MPTGYTNGYTKPKGMNMAQTPTTHYCPVHPDCEKSGLDWDCDPEVADQAAADRVEGERG